MGYIENIKSIMQWGNSFERQDRFPLDRTDLHISYDDAVLYAKGDGSDSRGLGTLAYVGQTITVWGLNEKGKEGVWVYSLIPHTPVDENDKTLADLKPVGSATTETATNYISAKALSEGLAVGQLIKVEEAVEVEETIDGATVTNTYQAGFYIVNAPGSISALGTTSGADDEIGALETRVSALEGSKVAKTDFEAYQGQVTELLGGKVDNSYKEEVSTALDAKVDDEEFSTYQGQVTEALAGKVDNSYKQEVETALSGKVDNSYKEEVSTALDAKVNDEEFSTYQGQVTEALATKATVDALSTLEGTVNTDIQNLTNHMSEYSEKVLEVEGRIDELESFKDAHITHEGISLTEIESLFETKTEE